MTAIEEAERNTFHNMINALRCCRENQGRYAWFFLGMARGEIRVLQVLGAASAERMATRVARVGAVVRRRFDYHEA